MVNSIASKHNKVGLYHKCFDYHNCFSFTWRVPIDEQKYLIMANGRLSGEQLNMCVWTFYLNQICLN